MPRFHSQDRTAAGIARSFHDAGLLLPAGMAQALAARIERDGGLQGALRTRNLKDGFASLTDEDRYLAELTRAEADADYPETALATLRHAGADVERQARLERVLARSQAKAA